MKLLVVLCLVAAAFAAPPSPTYDDNYYNNAEILRYENNNDGLGSYRYAFEQTDGTKQEQQGELRNQGREDESLAVKGTYSWIAPNGYRYTVTYTADEDGYQSEIEEAPGASPALVASLLG